MLRPAAVRLRDARHGQTNAAQILTALREPIRAGTPIVGLEPSCMTVFRDELIESACRMTRTPRRLPMQSFILSEFLHDQVPDYQPPELRRKAIVHGHCHHKSLLAFRDEADLLKRAGSRLRRARFRLLRHGRIVRL